MTVAPLLQVKDLRVGLRRGDDVLYAVDSVSFDIAPGETLGLVGESGSGKSTTGLALLRLTPRSSWPHLHGKILFDGHSVLAMNESQVRELRGRYISMVLQDPMTSLNPVFDIGDQIGEGIRAHTNASNAELPGRVVDVLNRVRIPDPATRLHAYPHQLSGGMKQRVVGAVAIACQPKLLIADEPTTSLDVTIQAQYLDLLKSLQRDSNMAMLFVTHDFGVVARMCDRVAVMYAGQIVETAPVRELFHKPAHWYTAALIGGIPKLGRTIKRLISIPGSPPRLDSMPAGCRFAPRCPNAQAQCHETAPPTSQVNNEHTVQCWFPKVSG
jgi:oligopeptide/dipeptide ABC transporter ATP-binding protein